MNVMHSIVYGGTWCSFNVQEDVDQGHLRKKRILSNRWVSNAQLADDWWNALTPLRKQEGKVVSSTKGATYAVLTIW